MMSDHHLEQDCPNSVGSILFQSVENGVAPCGACSIAQVTFGSHILGKKNVLWTSSWVSHDGSKHLERPSGEV